MQRVPRGLLEQHFHPVLGRKQTRCVKRSIGQIDGLFVSIGLLQVLQCRHQKGPPFPGSATAQVLRREKDSLFAGGLCFEPLMEGLRILPPLSCQSFFSSL